MIVEDQSATEAFLGGQIRSASARPWEIVATPYFKGVPLRSLRIHAQACGALSLFDLSTVTARLAACERELALNRRTAPGLYRAVRRIVRTQGEPSLSTPSGPWSMPWSRCAGSTRPTSSTPWRGLIGYRALRLARTPSGSGSVASAPRRTKLRRWRAGRAGGCTPLRATAMPPRRPLPARLVASQRKAVSRLRRNRSMPPYCSLRPS